MKKRTFTSIITTVSICSSLLMHQCANGQAASTPQTITTIIGNGTAGYSGDTGPATSAEIRQPGGLVFDTLGNIYLSDHLNNVIRKISATGIITTFAGTGTAGSIGDGGPAASAELNSQIKIVADNKGNMYIADFGNNKVRKINAAGIITTIAGTGTAGYSGDHGAATSATLYNPAGVAVDRYGNVYIADYVNNAVRKVDTLGIITTVAGNGTPGGSGNGGPASAALLNHPFGLAFDAAGNMYIADVNNEEIRIIDTSGTINIFAGTGVAGYNGDGIAATTAQLSNPAGVAVDDSGNVYIADQFNYRIRKVLPTGIITTIAGDGTLGYNGDCLPATSAEINSSNEMQMDRSGNLLICDVINNRVRKLINSTIGSLVSSPVNDTVEALSTTVFTVNDTSSSDTYQWQQNSGTGYVNLSNAGIYSGVTTPTLTITGVLPSIDNDLYRCIVSLSIGCLDTSGYGTLIIKDLGIGNLNNTAKFSIAPNPVTNELQITSTENIHTLSISNLMGQILYSFEYHTNHATVNVADLSPGIYFVKINGITTRKFLKE